MSRTTHALVAAPASMALAGVLLMAPAAPAAELVLHYTFDNDGAGNTAVNSGTGGAALNGTLLDGAARTPNAVTAPSALDTIGAGANGYVSVPSLDVADAQGDFSIATWAVVPDAGAGAGNSIKMIAANANAFPYDGFKFFVNGFNSNDRALHLETGCCGTVFSNPGAVPADGMYHHLAAVVDTDNPAGTQARLYVDGVEVTAGNTGSPVSPNTAAPLMIGRQVPNDAEPFPLDGLLDDFRIYRGQLNPDEVAALVPEPGGLVVLTGAALVTGLRRRRRRG